MATRNRNTRQRDPINWTLVLIGAISAVIISLIGPLSWRFVVQASPTELRIGLIWAMAMASVAAGGAVLVAVMNAFSRMTLRHIEQDDHDELRKSNQQFQQLAKILMTMQANQGNTQTSNELFQAMMQAVGGNGGAYRDVTQPIDLE